MIIKQKTDSEILKGFKKLESYKVPDKGEAFVGMCMEYFRSGKRLFIRSGLTRYCAATGDGKYCVGFSIFGNPHVYCVMGSSSGIVPRLRLS